MNTPRSLLFTLLLCAGVFLTANDALSQDMPTRYPLLELFTNTPCPICGNQDPGFFSRLSGYEGQYHLVSFYPGIPYSSCIFYQANTTDNTTRRNFYQIFGAPDVGINGIDFKSPNSVSTSVLDDITGGTSWLSVQVTETSGVERDVTITLEDHGGGDLETGLLFAVIVEREIMYDAPNGIMLHHNVFREFLTSVDGDEVDLSSGTVVNDYTYNVDIEWQLEEAYVVAWLMNPDTKEVINSGTKYDEVVASTKVATEALPLEIFPNPASNIINVTTAGNSNGVLRVFDATGRLMHRRGNLTGEQLAIDVADWSTGMYIVEILSGDTLSRGKVEVVR